MRQSTKWKNRGHRRLRRCGIRASALLAAVSTGNVAYGQLINSEWNTGNGTWNVAANWTPVGVPDNGGGFTFDVEIGNLAPAANAFVTFVPQDGTSDTINSLIISGGADLITNGFQLLVVGQTTVSAGASSIQISPHATPGVIAFNTDDLDVNSGGLVVMQGGLLDVDVLMEVNSGGILHGFGTVNLGSGGAAGTALENSGVIRVLGNSAAPQTLILQTVAPDLIDLDGTLDVGLVDVSDAVANANTDTLTLIVNAPLTDAFTGTLQIGQRDTLTFQQDLTFLNGDIEMNGGTLSATLNGAGAFTNIASSTISITSSARIDNDMTFTGAANTITVNSASTLALNGTVALPQANALVLVDNSSQLVIGGSVSVTDAAGDFNWDGIGAAITTITGNGSLNLAVDQVDTGNDLYGGVINLNDNADLTVNVTATSWTLLGAMNKNNAGLSIVSGDQIVISGDVTVNAGTLDLPAVTLQAGAGITVNGGLLLGAASTLAGPTTLGGTGVLQMQGTSTISANTTVNVSTFDWDGTGSGTGHTILDGVVFTVNSTTWDPDDAGDVDDNISLGGNGAQLIVNNVGSWGMSRTLNANTAAAGLSTIGGTSRMVLNGSLGVLNVTGNTTATAPLTFGSLSTASLGAATTLRLSGGNTTSNPNLISGGTIHGPGLLAADTNRALHGFGTINASVDFDGSSNLMADGGMLTVAGAILDVGTIGTADTDGTLNVVNAWNTNVASSVVLTGGILQGGVITNGTANGISGRGIVTSRVINTTMLRADGGALVFQTSTNDNDWDGAGNTGSLTAINNGVLDLRDNGVVQFAGRVIVGANSRVLVNGGTMGSALDFNPGSTITLNSGTYEATSSTDIGGGLIVGAGLESTIKVANNTFLTFESGSSSTLNGNLRLINNNINIESGATFSGAGAMIIPDGSHVVLDNFADIDVVLENGGAARPGNFNGIGRVDLFDYQQTDTGELYVELIGTALNAFDRFVASGDVVLDGYLNIDIDEISPGVPFVPSLGNTFNIITGNSVVGTFDYYDVSGMPAGLAFHVEYLANAVQLQVVNKPIFSADFDDDGDVDLTDLNIWRGAFDLNQLGDANGDNRSDLLDYILWRQQAGSMPAAPFSGPVPEPGIASAILSLLGITGLSRRVRRRAAPRTLAPIVCLFALLACSSWASAAPRMRVVNNGLNGGNREWLVQVAPDSVLYGGGHNILAINAAFELEFGQLVSATKNSPQWQWDLPRDHSPFTLTSGDGIDANLANDTVYAPLGSDPYLSNNFITAFTIVTQGSGPVAMRWGGHEVEAGSGPDVTGSVIVQSNQFFTGYRGSAAFGLIPGDTNFDGMVNKVDLTNFAQSWQEFGGWSNGDFDGNAFIDVRDLLLMSNNWFAGVPGASFDEAAQSEGLPAPSVPEPAALGLLAGIAPLLGRRRRS